jgi:MYXO-CTERM domain-containing protein
MWWTVRRAAAWAAAGVVVVSTCLAVPAGAAPIPPGTLWRDDFENNTTQDWVVGSPSPNRPQNITTGGPDGAGDNYLRLSASGEQDEPGSRLAVINRSEQWASNYPVLGVRQIEMDVQVIRGDTPLQMRLAFYSLGPNGFSSTRAATVPNDGRWHHIVLPVTENGLTQLGTVPYRQFFGAYEEIRLIHARLPGLRADTQFFVVGVDNITAVAPEPGALTLSAAGGFLLLRRRRR